MHATQRAILDAMQRQQVAEQQRLMQAAAEAPPGLDNYVQRWADEVRRVLLEKGR